MTEEERLHKIEADQTIIRSNFDTMTTVLNRVVDKLEVLSSHVATVMSSQGNVSSKTLVSIAAICVSTMGLGVSIVVIIGNMAQQPILSRLENIEEDIEERSEDWERFQYWKGRIDERTENAQNQLSSRVSDHDDAQNVKIDSLEKRLDSNDGKLH